MNVAPPQDSNAAGGASSKGPGQTGVQARAPSVSGLAPGRPSAAIRPDSAAGNERQQVARATPTTRSRRPVHSAFVPLLMGLLALATWFALQAWLLGAERKTLRVAHGAQQSTVENSARLRQSLDAIAADTQRLADAGNTNAQRLVEELRRRGVTINVGNTPQTTDQP